MLFQRLLLVPGFLTPSLACNPLGGRDGAPAGRCRREKGGGEPGRTGAEFWNLSRPVQYLNLLCGQLESLRIEGFFGILDSL